MDTSTLIQRLNDGEPGYKLSGELRNIPGPEASKILWQAIEAGEAPAAAQSGFWTYLGQATDEITAPRLLALVELHDAFIQSRSDDANYEVEQLFSGKPNSGGTWWNYGLLEVLKVALGDDRDLLVDRAPKLSGKLAMGLCFKLASQGLLTHEVLSDDFVDALAFDLTRQRTSSRNLGDVATIFADAPDRLWPQVAIKGAELGAVTQGEIWWEHSMEFSTPEQRAQWVLNIHDKAPMAAGLAFANKHFTEAEITALVDLLIAGKDAPANFNTPLWRPAGGALAAAIIADVIKRDERAPTAREEEAFRIGFKLISGAVEMMARALSAFDAETNEEFVLQTLSTTAPGRFMLIRGAMTPAVISRTIEVCTELADNAQSARSALKELHTIPLDERGPLKEAIGAADDAPAFLRELTVEVNYIGGEEALEIFEGLDRWDYVQVATDIDYFLHHSHLVDALRNRRSPDGFYQVKEYPVPISNLYEPIIPEDELPPHEQGGFHGTHMVVADMDSRLAIEAGLRDIPVATGDALPGLLGAPLHHVKESIPNLLSRRREVAELCHYHLGAPVSDEVVAQVERDVLGFALPQSLKNFYKAYNGVTIYMPAYDEFEDSITDLEAPLPAQGEQISWKDFMDRQAGPIFAENLARYEGFPQDQELFYFYTVNILPLEEVFLNNDWSDRFARDNVYLFDGFDDRRHAVLHVNPEREEILLRLVDEDENLFKYLPVKPEEYLEHLIALFTRKAFIKGSGVALKEVSVEPNLF